MNASQAPWRRRLRSGLLSAVLVSLSLFNTAWADPSSPASSSEILQSLQKLRVLGSVLYVAAHPDDENTGLIAYLSKGEKVETAYLSLTRGDGGQNLIGPQLREQLGVIRTQELLAARRVDGATQYFSRADDFGFSKSAVETLKVWDKEQVLGDLVWVVRSFQPDIVITRFSPEDEQTHGHHRASAQLALEGFEAAADPERFPEQLRHVDVWQPERVVWNEGSWFYRQRDLPAPEDDGALVLETGQFDSLLGRTYPEIAAASRSMHKSQGFGSAPKRGKQPERFQHLVGEPAQSDLWEGVDRSWARLAGGLAIDQSLQTVIKEFEPAAPYKSVPSLLKVRRQMAALPDSVWKERKVRDLDVIVAQCLGLRLRAEAPSGAAAPGSTLKVTRTAVQYSPLSVSWEGRPVLSGEPTEDQISIPIPTGPTHPYWLDGKSGEISLLATPENAPQTSSFELLVDGERLSYTVPVTHSKVDPVAGEVIEAVVVEPPISVSVVSELEIFAGEDSRDVIVLVKALQGAVSEAEVELAVPSGWTSAPERQKVSLRASEESAVVFRVTPPSEASDGFLRPQVKWNGQTWNRSQVVLDFPHFPRQTLHPRAEGRIVKLDLARKGSKVGYLSGAGDGVAEALQRMGYEVELLTPETLLNRSDLDEFQAIVLGIRSYNVLDEISALTPTLFSYVDGGGTLITQYNTSRGLKSETLGPYPLELSRLRVTDENAKVQILEPDHPILTTPNRIGPADFEGWVQERGLYFCESWDKRYTPLLACSDPGEEPLAGGLLVAKHGKGHFIYTSYSWFRQLPAGVPGAYRLFANMVSLGHE